MDKGRFDEKVVLVTGAARGIGKALASAFAQEGATVIINYNKSGKEAAALAGDLREKGYKAYTVKADVSITEEVIGMVDGITREHERIDVLVNNAGIRKDSYLAMMAEEDWDGVINTNLKSVYNTCKWISRVMISQRSGRIINVTSVSAEKGLAGQTNYSASKGGMISFTKSLARELGPYGITVNAVAPGLIETDMTKGMGARKDDILERVPLGRSGRPEDVTGGVLFLASGDADYITGYTLFIDGGLAL